jgi:uncharacterized protein (TIRG00374 family)
MPPLPRRPAVLVIWAAVLVTVGAAAYRHRDTLVAAFALLTEARIGWLVPAALAIAGLYACRAAVYAVPLRLLGQRVPRRRLWTMAVVATSVHQLVPTGGASGYAFLTYAMHQSGVTGARAPLVALIDTLSHATALATLVLASLVYLLVGGTAVPGGLAATIVPGLVLVALAAWLYALQRDPERFGPAVLGLKDRVARVLGRRWSDAPVRKFLDEYYTSKDMVGRHPRAFVRMMTLQYVAIGLDVLALYLCLMAVGLRPHPWVPFMGLVIAMAGVEVVSVPGGGGSFEVILSAFIASRGLDGAAALAGTLLYRIVAFWLPVALSLVLLRRLRRRQT